MQPRLSARDLACRRGDRLLFRGLSFELAPGEALQVAGANGAGKSSLLRIIAGLLRPLEGTVQYGSSAGLLDDRLPLDEHLPLGRAFQVWNGIDRRVYAGSSLASVGLAGLDEIPVRFLSTGQRKRAALLLTIASSSGLWLLDEPLNGLDTVGAALVIERVRAFREQGGMVILASHQPLSLPNLRTIDLADFSA
jgi:heme exporter protein A